MSPFTKLFWKDVLERMLSTLAQVALGLLTADTFLSLASIPWEAWAMTLFASGAGVVLKCLAAAKVSNSISPASLFTRDTDELP